VTSEARRRRPVLLHPLLFLLPAASVLAGCEGAQSIMAPGGADARVIAKLSWIVFIGGALIFALVMALTAYAMLGREASRRWVASHGFIIGGGIVFPVVTLTALLIYGMMLTGSVGRSAMEPALSIDVTGEQFWWRVRYNAGSGGEAAFDSANELHVPTGQPVELKLRTSDVIHSFWVPSLGGKLDMIPGQENRLTVTAETPGVYRGQCAEYCGLQHTQMAFHVVAHAPEDFQTWLTGHNRPAAEPATDAARQGRTLFLQAGCGACHAVRGTEARGVVGPDLTHVGARRWIGAGMIENTGAAALAGWIAGAQHIKPGSRMPSFDALEGEQLAAIAAYLESLK
jgi:cytochrome c oxidase subunit II